MDNSDLIKQIWLNRGFMKDLNMQKESLDLQKLMLFFMKSINRDNKQIIENL